MKKMMMCEKKNQFRCWDLGKEVSGSLQINRRMLKAKNETK